MKRIWALIFLAAATLAWSSESHAQRQTAPGNGITALSAGGSVSGVDMQASGTTGTLTVGTIGGPQLDIFSSNAALTSPLQAVSTQNNGQGNIQFNSSSNVFGAIGVTPPGGPFLRNITGGNTGTTVNFFGSVFAQTTTVNQTGTLNFDNGGANRTNLFFAGDGTIGLAANTTVTGNINAAAANTGTLTLGSGSVLDGPVAGGIGLKAINITGGSNLAGVTATITAQASAFSYSIGTNTLIVDGQVTVANSGLGGVINVTLASASVFGTIRPFGPTNLGPSLLLNVNVPAGAIIPAGQIFNIVQIQTGVPQSGTSGTIVTVVSSNPLYRFQAVPGGGTVNGLIAIELIATPVMIPLNPGNLPPTAPIAAAVAGALLGTNLAILGPINALTDPVTIVNALAQLAPSAPAVAAGFVTFENSRQFQNLWLARLDETMCSQVRLLAPGEDRARCPQPESGWWMKGFGYWGSQGATGSFVGYNTTIVGGMMGYDKAIDPAIRVGLGVGYSRSVINGSMFDAQTSFNSYRVTAYAAYEPGAWFLYGEASLGLNSYAGNRHVVFPGVNQTAQSNYDGQEYTGSLTAGYHFFVQGLTITPLASLQYTRVNLGGYTENGSPDIDLAVQSQTYDFLQSGLGVTVKHPFAVSGGALVPDIHFKWLYMLSNPTLQNTASFTAGSPAFTAPGLQNANSTFNAGIGVTFLSCGCSANSWSIQGTYDFYGRSDDYHAHAGMLRFTGRF